MTLALWTLERVMGEAMSLEAGDLEARAPRVQELSEQRFVNVIAEVALAAAVSPPRVLVVSTGKVSMASNRSVQVAGRLPGTLVTACNRATRSSVFRLPSPKFGAVSFPAGDTSPMR